MIQKFISTLLFSCILGAAFGQKSQTKPSTLNSNETTQIHDTQYSENSDLLKLYADQGVVYFIKPLNSGKWTEIEKVLSVDKTRVIPSKDFLEDIQKESFNPLIYSWRPRKYRQYYHLSGTDLYFIIPSQTDLKRSI
ncbi:MAG: hypothetical protein KJ941_06515 [Bacteroidetes bacterium]|nr:hypothetical protein [Bacteroidota bacterium]